MTDRRKPPARSKQLEQQLDQIGQQLRKYSEHLPPDRKPTILICGKVGNGKTTTINTLFGKQVGEIGFYRRGTKEDAVYEWESESEDINIIDLPGLGDSPKYDKVFREMYERRVAQADGFIVVLAPPRPAEEGTLKTVRLLLRCKVPSQHIIFGFNKLTQLDYPVNGHVQQVEMKGLLGPTNESHERAVAEARRAFYEDLCHAFPRAKFSEDQIIPFDSRTGWNLHRMLLAVIDTLPFQTLMRLRRAAAEAQREARRREEARLKAERERLLAEERRLRKEREEVRKKQRAAAAQARKEENDRRARREEDEQRRREEREARALEKRLRERERELEDMKKDYQRQHDAMEQFSAQTVQVEKSVMKRIFTAVEEAVTSFDPHLGKAARELLEVGHELLPKAAEKAADVAERVMDKTIEAADKVWKKVSSWWRSW